MYSNGALVRSQVYHLNDFRITYFNDWNMCRDMIDRMFDLLCNLECMNLTSKVSFNSLVHEKYKDQSLHILTEKVWHTLLLLPPGASASLQALFDALGSIVRHHRNLSICNEVACKKMALMKTGLFLLNT